MQGMESFSMLCVHRLPPRWHPAVSASAAPLPTLNSFLRTCHM